MTPWLKRHFIITIATLALLTACSSGGESGTGLQPGQTTVGEISGFGSIFVNGVEFNTDNAAVTIDGLASGEANLAVGMVVTVNGTVNADGVTGTASTVTAKTEVEGLVFANNYTNTGGGTINVMGQTIHISHDTQFKSEIGTIATLEELVPLSTVVEISGYSDGKGDIYATYVKAVESGTASEVKLHGIVSNLTGDATSGSFGIGDTNIVVRYNADTTFEYMAVGDLANGLYVSVESGGYSSGSSDVLAKEIHTEQLNAESEGSEVEIQGVVTDAGGVAADSGQFELNGRVVQYDAMTQFEGGDTTAIANEVRLDVSGTVQSDNSILANEIKFREESDNEIEGNVDSVGNNSLVINDGVTTVTVTVNELTKYEDETNRTFNFSDITQDMTLEAKYYTDSDLGMNVATSISR
ncbi:MAG: DUF5666 domain-containing protein [Gammaproteobacteria bacterium]|jgi:hypothetical protein